MSEKQWFYHHEGQEHGPHTDREIIEKIKAGELSENVPIRREDLDEYIPATLVMRKGKAATTGSIRGSIEAQKKDGPIKVTPIAGSPKKKPEPAAVRAREGKEADESDDEKEAQSSPGGLAQYGLRGVVAFVVLVMCAGTAAWFWSVHLPRKRAEEAAIQKAKDDTEAQRLADEARAKARAEELARKEAERKAAEEAALKARRVTQLTQIGTSWTNSLGMKFVPVVGTKVLFCVHKARVQDYAPFIESTKRDWFKPSFEQGPAHPVVNVSWLDAAAFCNWLTARERLSGHLGPRDEYRLPSDLGWSAAVGLLKEDGSTPSERHLKVRRVYPWGENWPPPKDSGNFDKSLGADDFEFTSTVCSFPPNEFGIYDLAGNATEWCLDWMDSYQTARVVRGSSHADRASDRLHSSFRMGKPPTRRMAEIGFRVVVYVAEEAAASSQ
ncbi:MAG: SUMF1/EgtB/PvdO family nonheme iron enzyme [Verrucomicrobia bacterium]|nr:SUMF1/EgtB/PvdO family nonheme iron enzyme [Verrucomicrobiota bacterium]